MSENSTFDILLWKNKVWESKVSNTLGVNVT